MNVNKQNYALFCVDKILARVSHFCTNFVFPRIPHILLNLNHSH